MKKSLLALAALTAFAGVASAQSSVTLFGVVDLGLRNVKNATSVKSMSQDGISSSRLGFRGVEDLGGGMRAGFWLEGATAPDIGCGTSQIPAPAAGAQGCGGQTWQRRSTMSLMGGFGEIRLGRDYTPDFWNHTIYDPFGTNGVGSSVNTFSALNGATTLVRSNNSVGYFLPAMGGLFGQFMVSAGENVNGNKHIAGRLGYAAGPVNMAVSFGKTEVTGALDWKRMNIGGSFNLGFMTLMGQYNTSDGDAAGEIKHILLGGLVPMGQSSLKFSYVKSDGSGAISTRDATQMAFGYQYDLSKRTAMYATYARISNKSGASYSVGSPPGAPAAGKNSTGYEFGLRHSF